MTDRPVRRAEDAKRGMFALSIALDETDGGKLLAAVGEFAETRAPLFERAAGDPD